VVGAWPLDLDPTDAAAVAGFAERIAATMRKAVREGKEQSSWGNPNEAYEAALSRFVASALDAGHANPFLTDLAAFVERIARLGSLGSLAQTALKLTLPGVPDTYQGGELWDFSLVDPDNRRPVDFAVRRQLLGELRRFWEAPGGRDFAALARQWRDGREKLFLIWRILGLRAAEPALFAGADYAPLAAEGSRAGHLIAFRRRHEGRCLAVVVPRLIARFRREDGTIDWGETRIALPESGSAWRDILTERSWPGEEPLAAAALLADFPVAVLVAE